MNSPRIAAVVLAAGQSRRMGSNKLLADLHGMPLIAQTVQRIASAGVESIFVVTGHQAELVQQALATARVSFVHNPNYASGLASSLRAGVAAAKDHDALLICLGDMPLVQSADLKRMLLACHGHQSIVVPVKDGMLGNPVLWGRSHVPQLMALTGDLGARGILEANRNRVTEIAVIDDGVLFDADTPEALARLRKR